MASPSIDRQASDAVANLFMNITDRANACAPPSSPRFSPEFYRALIGICARLEASLAEFPAPVFETVIPLNETTGDH